MSIFDIFKKKSKQDTNVNSAFNHNTSDSMEDEDEIAAVISAVIASMNEEETEVVAAITAAIACILGKSTSEFIVKNIKRSPDLDSIWAHAGRMKLMR